MSAGLDGAGLGSLLRALGNDPVETFADVGGNALPLALALYERYGCQIRLIDIDHKGQFPGLPSPWTVTYVDALGAAGVPADQIKVIRAETELRPTDVIANLGMFGGGAKIKHIAPILKSALHADSRLISDIRKGSGAFPFFKDYGSTEILTRLRAADGEELTRVLFRPDGVAPAEDPGEWVNTARALAGPQGFYTHCPTHSFLFVPRGQTLIVTFDNLDMMLTKREDRRPWGYEFIEKQGFSMLAVMAEGWTWFRDAWVGAEFDRLRDEGFFARFERVVFYGASMGGYGAAAYSAACPGADVVVISPQSTLDRAVVPWETRYHKGWGLDYSGPYGDAAQTIASARRVMLFYDPHEPLDLRHGLRFVGPNVVTLRAPMMGHRMGTLLAQMGILSEIMLAALDGRLTPLMFYRALRKRHGVARYQRELFHRALARGRPDLARRVGRWVLARGDSPVIRKAMAQL